MTRNKDTFLKFKKEKGCNVYFVDNGSTKILGKGIVILVDKNSKAENVIPIENMNHNLLVYSKCVIKDTLSPLIQENEKYERWTHVE